MPLRPMDGRQVDPRIGNNSGYGPVSYIAEYHGMQAVIGGDTVPKWKVLPRQRRWGDGWPAISQKEV